MPTFKISGVMTVSVWTEVEAETEEEALEIAKKRHVADHHIDRTYEASECFMFDNDGTPTDLRIDED